MYPKKQGKRSARPRGKNSTPWAPLDGLLNSEKEPSRYGNDQNVLNSENTNSNQGGNMPCRASKRVQKLKDNIAKDANTELLAIKTDITERIDPKKRGKRSVRPWGDKTASEMVEENSGADNGFTLRSDTSAEVKEGNGSDADAVEHTDTSSEVQGCNHVDANVVKPLEEVSTADTLCDLKDSNGAIDNALEQTAVQMIDAVNTQQGETNNAEFDPVIFSGLNLGIGDGNFDLSSAESALASLYGDSKRDSCIEFAVKLLMNEAPLPKEAAEVEDFFNQKMNGEKCAKAGRKTK